MSQAFLDSPLGIIRVEATGGRLSAITLGSTRGRSDIDPLLDAALGQLAEWLAGRRTDFALPLEPPRTPRGPAHRDAIAAIAYGETASYGELARRLESSPRAVGQACRRNPFPIVIPCHRVLGAGGAIGHYSGGEGIVTKQWLLDHEQRKGS